MRPLSLTTPIRLALLVLLVGVFVGGALRADVTVPDRTGLVAEPVTVQVVRGNEVAIPLQAGGARQGVIQYLLHEGSAPKAGTLGPIVPGPNGATVVYRSDPNSDLKEDSFRFRAKTKDNSRPPSSATLATIKLIEPVPLLQVQADLDFGRVPKDGDAMKDLMVRNVGTGDFEGALELDGAFTVVGEKVLRVPVGGVKVVTVRFAPNGSTEPAQKEWVLQRGNPNGAVWMRGRGFAQFSASVARIVFKTDRETWKRKASMKVTNPGKDDIILRIKAPVRVTADPDDVAELPAGESIDIDFTIPSIDVEAFVGKLVLSEKAHQLEIPMSGNATPARVAISEPGIGRPLVFDGEFGDTLRATVKMDNTGGQTAFVSATVNPPFKVVEGSDGRPLGPEESLTFHVELQPDRIGPVNERLKIHGGDRLLTIPLVGTITLPPGMEPPPPPPEPDPGERLPGTIRTAFLVDGDSDIRRVDGSIPTVDMVTPGVATENAVSFSWRHPAGDGDWDYAIETEVHRIDEETGMPYPQWVELGEELAQVSLTETKAKVTVQGLKPGGKYTFRILTIDGINFSKPGKRQIFLTVPKERFLPWLKLWMVVGVAAAGLLLVVLWRRARAEQLAYG